MMSTPAKISKKSKRKKQKQDAEEADIYQNLPDFEDYDVKLEKLQTLNESLKTKLQELENKVETLTQTNAKLTKVERALSRNISVLFATALAEVQYKDKVITELRKERDSLIFRRYHRREPTLDTAPSTLPPREQLQRTEDRAASTYVPNIEAAHPEDKQKQDVNNSTERISHQERYKKYLKPKDASDKNNSESSKYENKESTQTVWGTSNKKASSQSYGITPLVSSKSKLNCPKSEEIKKVASFSSSPKTIKHSPSSSTSEIQAKKLDARQELVKHSPSSRASEIQAKKLDAKQELVKQSPSSRTSEIQAKKLDAKQESDVSVTAIINVSRIPKDNLHAPVENMLQKTPVRSDFRIPKLKSSKIDADTSVLGDSGVTLHETSKQAQQSEQASLTSESEEMRANTSVDVSLSTSSECVFSARRKSRIKILSVSREENEIEEVPVTVETGVKRKFFSTDSSYQKPSKILCSDTKLQDSSKNVLSANNDSNNEAITTNTVLQEVLDKNINEEKDVKDENATSNISDNICLEKNEKREVSDLQKHKSSDVCQRQRQDRALYIRQPQHKPNIRGGDRSSRYHREDHCKREYHSRSRRDDRYRRKSRSPTYERAKRNATFRFKSEHSKRSTSPDSCKTSDTKEDLKQRSLSPDVSLVEERNRLREEIDNLRGTNEQRSSESPDLEGYLKTSLSDTYFSEDEEKLMQSIKNKTSVKTENSFHSRRRQESGTDSDEASRRRRNNSKRLSRPSRNISPRRDKSRSRRTRSSENQRRSATDKLGKNHSNGKDLRDKLSKGSSKTSATEKSSEVKQDSCVVKEQTTVGSNKVSHVLLSHISKGSSKTSATEKSSEVKQDSCIVKEQTTVGSKSSQEDDLSKLSEEIVPSPEIMVRKTRKQILRLSYDITDVPDAKSVSVKQPDEVKQIIQKVISNEDLEEGELSDSD